MVIGVCCSSDMYETIPGRYHGPTSGKWKDALLTEYELWGRSAGVIKKVNLDNLEQVGFVKFKVEIRIPFVQ